MEWTGGCLCGAVRYRATVDPIRVVNCHCGMCRRASGAAFLTHVHFPIGLHVDSGQSNALSLVVGGRAGLL